VGVDARWNPTGEWELREPITGTGIVLPPAETGGSPRLLIADISGSVWLFAADRVGPHLRRWKPGGGLIPEGKPTSNFAVQDAQMMRIVAYVADGKAAIGINPDREEPLWAARTAKGDDVSSQIVGSAQPAGDNRWVITDLSGRVVLVDGTSGGPIVTLDVGLPGAVPATASGVAANKVLTPLSDGSAVILELPSATPAPPPKPKEKE
jgi:hypothetical protein